MIVHITRENIDIEVDEPLSNDAGSVLVQLSSDCGIVDMELTIDEAMRAKGITHIKSVSHEVSVMNGGTRAIRVYTNLKGEKLLGLASRPALDALIANRNSISGQIRAAFKAVYDARAEALRTQAAAEEAEIVKQIPVDHVRVDAVEVVNYDIGNYYKFSAGKIELRSGLVTVHGKTSACPNTVVASISAAELAQIEAEIAGKAYAEAAKSDARKAEVAAKFSEAAATGQPVFITSYPVDCDGSARECNTDIISVYAQPNGTKTESRVHTH